MRRHGEGKRNEDEHWRRGQKIDPDAAPGEQRFLEFEPDDSFDLGPPESVHRTASSLPIKYS
jgi:hypothetical protein